MVDIVLLLYIVEDEGVFYFGCVEQFVYGLVVVLFVGLGMFGKQEKGIEEERVYGLVLWGYFFWD